MRRRTATTMLLSAGVSLSVGCPADEDAMQDSATSGIVTATSDAQGGESSGSDGPSTTTSAGTTASDESSAGGSGGPGAPPIKLDLGEIPDAPGGSVCGAPPPVTCDDEDDDLWHAIGLNCPGGPQVTGVYNGDPISAHVHTGDIGTYQPPPFPPMEGEKILIISSGRASDLLVPNLFASTDVAGYVDNGGNLPVPIQTNVVSQTEDCTANPGLVGSGDCSNTIDGQWTQGNGAFDYTEMRFTVTVPAGTFGFSYNLAMFSTEYPVWYQTVFNDMYIAWLESEQWTGNVSFDEMGNPISLNAGFLDYKDAPNMYDCPAPCTAPELQGTAMMGHAGTKWLTTTAGVTSGEDIEVVFAVFDLSDPILDTVVLLDNFEWTCEGGPPITIPN